MASLTVLAGLGLVLLLGGCGEDSGGHSPDGPQVTTTPALSPEFAWNRSDYVIRCEGDPVEVKVSTPEGWQARAGQGERHSGTFSVDADLEPGRALPVTFTRDDRRRQYFIRCLPADFPEYETTGSWSGAPRITVVQMENRYAVALDRHGTPVWWLKTPEGNPGDAKFLADGRLAYAPVKGIKFRHYILRNLDGRGRRVLTAGNGLGTDSHDLQLLPNGNLLIGAHRRVPGVNTSRFGGRKDSVIDTAQVQELTPSGKVVWSWNAYPRISLAETGRWWKTIADSDKALDIHHWNSVERRGDRILLSFRHLDAVYLIDRGSGEIIWKLGGTRTRHSLETRRDPRARYPLGGQHDARFLPDGTVTIFDNATRLKPARPRAVRYRIHPGRNTATMLEQVTDPDVKLSVGFGSSRRSPNGNWMIGWGPTPEGIVGSYSPGRSPARFRTGDAVSYRANPVIGPRPTVPELRRAMDRIAAREK